MEYCFCFDLDGTLLDTKEEILHLLLKAIRLTDSSIPYSYDELFILYNGCLSLRENLLRFLPGTLVNTVENYFRDFYDHSDHTQVKLYPGILAILEHLAINHRLYLMTKKPKFSTYALLDQFKLRSFFTRILTYDDFPSKKEQLIEILNTHPLHSLKQEPLQAVVISDNEEDIQNGKKTGCITVFHASGYGNLLSTNLNADIIIKKMEYLQLLLTEWVY